MIEVEVKARVLKNPILYDLDVASTIPSNRVHHDFPYTLHHFETNHLAENLLHSMLDSAFYIRGTYSFDVAILLYTKRGVTRQYYKKNVI
jgi:hypothetical protein